jgi:hypothetical protein
MELCYKNGYVLKSYVDIAVIGRIHGLTRICSTLGISLAWTLCATSTEPSRCPSWTYVHNKITGYHYWPWKIAKKKSKSLYKLPFTTRIEIIYHLFDFKWTYSIFTQKSCENCVYCFLYVSFLSQFNTFMDDVTYVRDVEVCMYSMICYVLRFGVRGGAVGWGTAIQVERSRVRFPIVSLEFFIGIILPAALWPWGWLSY